MDISIQITAARVTVMAGLIDTGGVYEAVDLRLYQNDYTPTPATVLADLTAATYSGYAAEAIAFAGPVIGSDGKIRLVSVGALFQPTSSTVTNTVFGWYITNTGGTVLLAAGRFESPVPMMGVTSGVEVTPAIQYGQ